MTREPTGLAMALSGVNNSREPIRLRCWLVRPLQAFQSCGEGSPSRQPGGLLQPGCQLWLVEFVAVPLRNLRVATRQELDRSGIGLLRLAGLDSRVFIWLRSWKSVGESWVPFTPDCGSTQPTPCAVSTSGLRIATRRAASRPFAGTEWLGILTSFDPSQTHKQPCQWRILPKPTGHK